MSGGHWTHAVGSWLGLDVANVPSHPNMMDFVTTAWIAFVILALRLVSERVFIPIIEQSLKAFGHSAHKKAAQIFDDLFIATCSGLLELQVKFPLCMHAGRKEKVQCQPACMPRALHATQLTRQVGPQAILNVLYWNGNCTPWSTGPCLAGWNNTHTLNIAQR
jgi:hypothetical protein